MNSAILKHEKLIESIDAEKIILDEEGKYPRRVIIKGKDGIKKEYRLVKTQSGSFIINK